ncbi:MAG: TIGR02206 family membrane protein [Anaerolineales bacterium]|nr:TIGR02206 family membrane protein [Anaerolineales bacterium]
MEEFFAWDYHGAPFELFGPAHIAGLIALLLLNLSLLPFKKADEAIRARIRLILAIILWANEIAWHAWKIFHGQWTLQSMLPLQICSLMVWVSGIMLVTRSYKIYEFAYFLGIGGGLQALATPDLGLYGFPHFRYFQTFLSHGLIVAAPIYMTAVEGFRPTWKSMWKAILWMNVYALAIYFVNDALGSNYLMVNAKPDVPSLLDLLPEWPWYILWMEGIGVLTFLLLYFPFILKDLKTRKNKNA